MKTLFAITIGLIIAGCSSTPKKPKVGECIRKDTKEYKERVYRVKKWEADGTPEVKDLVTGKVKALLEYRPDKYRIIKCPSRN